MLDMGGFRFGWRERFNCQVKVKVNVSKPYE